MKIALALSSFLLLLFCSLSSYAQFKPSLNDGFDDSYYYKLNTKQTSEVFHHPQNPIDSGIFAKLFYISPVDADSLILPQGNYLKVSFEDNKMGFEYLPVTNWRVYFIGDDKKASVQLIDLKTNKPAVVASVYYDNQKLKYDEKTATYPLKKNASDGVISVIDQNETFYFNLAKQRYNTVTPFQQRMNRFLYKDPTRYATVLYQFYNRFPMDAIRFLNFKRNYINCYRYARQTGYEIWNRLANTSSEKETFNSYFYFSKPKYRPDDTIKFKCHILQNFKKGIWYNKPVLVFLDEYGKKIFLGKVYSKRPGAGYDFQFVIQDSMDIDLDDDYEITLKDIDSNRLASGRFTYEAYELQKSVFKITLSNGTDQYKGKPFEVVFSAKDENGLPMPDTKASITIVADKITYIKPNELFIPDTLWSYSFAVKKGEARIIIPDSIFPEANLDYSLNVVMQNSENEQTDLNRDIIYHLFEESLQLDLIKDSIYITGFENEEQKVRVYAEDKFEFRVVDTFVKTPCRLSLNTHAEIYYCENDESNEDLHIGDISADVSAKASRSKDSVFLSLYNPRRLAVVYYLSESGKEIKKGTQYDFPFAIPAKDKSYYNLRVEYIWAGITKGENTFIPSFKNNIRLNIEQPAVITPGKESEINITATDYDGHPVQNLNLLSYAYTQKFDGENIPALPYQEYIRQYDNTRNVFELEENNDHNNNILLDYPFWNAKLILDTNWTYRFRYPSQNKIEYTHIEVNDSITQFAPFVMDNGEPQAIQYIYIDHIPVYLGFTDEKMAYSFVLDTNYHSLQIRTAKKLIVTDSLKVKPFIKTLFSIDQNHPGGSFTSVSMPDSFTKGERENLSLYVLKIKMPDNNLEYTYLERKQDEGQYFDLSKSSNTNRRISEITVGPVYWRYWNFGVYNDFSRSFEYEPGYTYTFDANLVKMTSNEFTGLVPRYLTTKIPDINDVALTKEHLLKGYEALDIEERRRFIPNIIQDTANMGSCHLTIDYDKNQTGFYPINIMLCRPGDFNYLNVYAGRTTTFSNLKPGQYQVILVEQYNSYLQSGVINVKENGTNFYRITKTDTLKGLNVTLINKALQALYKPLKVAGKEDIGILMNELLKSNKIYKAGCYSGVVLDGEDGNEPLIGASIKLVGANIGTQTDIDGNFEIIIPDNNNSAMLEISYIGRATQTIRANQNMKVVLTQDNNALTEVVITTPYGPPISKGNYVGAADVVRSRGIELTPVVDIAAAIEAAAPGVQVTNGSGEPGSGANIQIRGRGSVSGSVTPLIVLNGAPFDGDITELDPSMVESINILKDAMATSLYGARGSNGVIIITTKKGADLPERIKKGLQEMPPSMTEDLMVSSLRNNFRDDAYWQPDLVTDENGKASFKVKFPDDITNWKTLVIATDDKKHTGYAVGNIKSYKPVAASLYLPHFLLDGDSALLIGKAVNYIPDTIPATTAFYQNDMLKRENKIHLGPFHNDTLLLTATGADSIKLKYVLTKEDGYFDGEEKTIPLQRVGVKVAEGSFVVLDKKDTSFTIYPARKRDTLHLSATASLVDVLLDEVNVVRDYGYMCNEQKASKILAFLGKQKMYTLLQKPFEDKDRRYVQHLIDKIIKSRNEDHQWGWWDESQTIPWISNHVLKTLMKAKAMGYNCNIDIKAITDAYVFNLERDTMYTDLPTLQLLAEYGVALNYEKYISRLEHNRHLTLNASFELILLRQKLHLPYKLDKLTA